MSGRRKGRPNVIASKASTTERRRASAGIRVTGAWLAGISHMPWWRFLAWNAAGGIAWATAVGLVAYYLGRAAADLITRYGLIGAGVLAALVLAGAAGVHFWRLRMEKGT